MMHERNIQKYTPGKETAHMKATDGKGIGKAQYGQAICNQKPSGKRWSWQDEQGPHHADPFLLP